MKLPSFLLHFHHLIYWQLLKNRNMCKHGCILKLCIVVFYTELKNLGIEFQTVKLFHVVTDSETSNSYRVSLFKMLVYGISIFFWITIQNVSKAGAKQDQTKGGHQRVGLCIALALHIHSQEHVLRFLLQRNLKCNGCEDAECDLYLLGH